MRKISSIVKEGFPRAVVEAMACGCATVATSSGGTPEAIGSHGILLDEATQETIKHALYELVHDPERIDRLGRAARAHAIDNLDINAKAIEYDSLLRKCKRETE